MFFEPEGVSSILQYAQELISTTMQTVCLYLKPSFDAAEAFELDKMKLMRHIMKP